MRNIVLISRRLSMTLVIMLIIVLARTSEGQTFNVIHYFSGGADGANPFAGVIIDAAGDLYGTTAHGGDRRCGCGTVYKLKQNGSGWLLTLLYSFKGPANGDGASPVTRLTVGPYGTLYGTTEEGGAFEQGTVFSLRPPARATGNLLGGWTESILYQFGQRQEDGSGPDGTLIFDDLGNVYGTNPVGGLNGAGTVFELSPSGSGWLFTTIYDFSSGGGGQPYAGVVLDSSGSLYGAAYGYGGSDGAVFKLARSGSGWAETTLYNFQGGRDGQNPHGGLIFDHLGNLYGAAFDGGSGNGGTVFALASGSYTFDLLYSLPGGPFGQSGGPIGSLTMDAAGNLYGATNNTGIFGYGSVFKLIPNGPASWTYVDLYDFTGESDGAYPLDGVTLDSDGNVFGTASDVYGVGGSGVVFEITP